MLLGRRGVQECHIGATIIQLLCDGSTDILRGSGDDCRLAGERETWWKVERGHSHLFEVEVEAVNIPPAQVLSVTLGVGVQLLRLCQCASLSPQNLTCTYEQDTSMICDEGKIGDRVSPELGDSDPWTSLRHLRSRIPVAVRAHLVEG